MQAVILAAGLGTRLRPLTDSLPKCMVQVNGTSIIENQISNLVQSGINDIFVVAGYKSDILRSFLSNKFPFIYVIDNNDYKLTNNMYSLYLTKDYVFSRPFLLMNADVFFDKNIIEGLVDSSEDNMVACDVGRYIEESMKISVNEKGNISHISKQLVLEETYATSIDIYKIGSDAGILLFNQITYIIKINKNINSWTEVALDQIFDKIEFTPYKINGRWFEIDNFNDLKAAESVFKY